MIRRAYALLVGVAVLMGILAVVASLVLDLPIRDPDGFLGPAWTRLPALVLGAFLADVVPRSLWRTRRSRRGFLAEARQIVNDHWTRDRITLVVLGLAGFYITYVSYRNLKSYLPSIREDKYDTALHAIDRAMFLGGDPALFLHAVLGEGISAHVLAFAYLIFLPFVPVSLVGWLVWTKNISVGYWYATAQCLCWSLGTASYYALPSLGPGFTYPWLYADLPDTGVSSLQSTLSYTRADARWVDPFNSMQGVAGFASLHVAIVLCAALVAHYTVRQLWIRRSLWVFFVLTVVATLYFGWHYIADDVAGALIAVVSVWLAGIATGQRFERRWRSSYPTTTTTHLAATDRSS